MQPTPLKTCATLFSLLAASHACASTAAETGEGSLIRALFGDTLQKDYGILAFGLVDAGFSRNNRSTHDERKSGLTNQPIIGYADEGLELGNFGIFIDKALDGTMVPRITPQPGPMPKDWAFGFTFEAEYGRNAQNARTVGWDANWAINQPGASDPAKAARDKQLFLAVPNLAATAYVPYGPGINVMAGVFGLALGYEIPPNVRNARNKFASKSYAFMTESITATGVLLGTRLVNDSSMILGAELGVIQGTNNMRDNNDAKSVTGALRWRTPDMKTWIDYEFLVGNAQNDSTADVQSPKSRLISADSQFKQQHSLNAWHSFDSQWSMGAELMYGRQDGDGKRTTVDIITGPGFSGASWWGVNSVVTYQRTPDLAYSIRAEHFDNKDGFALFPATTARGAFNAITTGFRYDLNKNVSLRPEVRYDWFDAKDKDRPFGNGQYRSQVTGIVEALIYF